MDARGGQLEIAGVVVGSWGPNLPGGNRGGRSGNQLSPHVMSVGGPHKGYEMARLVMQNLTGNVHLASREGVMAEGLRCFPLNSKITLTLSQVIFNIPQAQFLSGPWLQ